MSSSAMNSKTLGPTVKSTFSLYFSIAVLDIENSGCGDPFWKATLKYMSGSCSFSLTINDLLKGCVEIQQATSSILASHSSLTMGSAMTECALKKIPAHAKNFLHTATLILKYSVLPLTCIDCTICVSVGALPVRLVVLPLTNILFIRTLLERSLTMPGSILKFTYI